MVPTMSPETAEAIARRFAEQSGIDLIEASVSHVFSSKGELLNTSHPSEDMWCISFKFPKRFKYDDWDFCVFEIICNTGAVRAIPLN
jgi:hypothetical protein